MSEMSVHRLLGKGPFRPQVGDFQRLLPGQAGRHDFPKQPQDLGIAERALVALEDAEAPVSKWIA